VRSGRGRSSTQGLFIAFEGGEGTGKSTQVALLARHLAQAGVDALCTFEPGDSPAGAAIRELVLDPATGHLDPRAEALLYAADRAHHVARVVRPALARGAAVLTDRYLDSSLAYQGAGRTLDREEVERLSTWATEGLLPDLTVLLDIEPAVGLRRAGNPDRLEAEPLAFHERVRQAFLELAARAPARYVVLDADRPRAVVAAEVAASVDAIRMVTA
jgi:dTMP kinase